VSHLAPAAKRPLAPAPLLDHALAVPAAAALAAALVTLPFLGTVGLWDPWETHYTEVGRQMLERGDLVHPFWQDAWFFSKPALTPWLAALGLGLAGVPGSQGAMPPDTSLWVRLPFALLSIAAVAVLASVVASLASRRAGLLAGLVLGTSPLWVLVSRQAMTDLPFAACVTVATGCLARRYLQPEARARWAVAAWVAMALGALAKGLLGPGLPLASLGLFALLERRPWPETAAALRRLAPPAALVAFAAVALPWYLAMLRFDGVDNEGKTFFQRFFLHDHLARLTTGVYSSTPGGSFTYFVEQGAWGFFPWVGLVPLAVLGPWPSASPAARLGRLAATQGALTFVLFSASATRFHHYILPALPALAVAVGLALDGLLQAPAPPRLLALGAVLAGLAGRDLALAPRRWLELFTFNQERPYPDALDAGPVIAGAPAWLDAHRVGWLSALVAAAALAALAWWGGSAPVRRRAVGALAAAALAQALWLSWVQMERLGPHWTQRELFERYFALRQGDEPIAAFWMDWKGETFYSRNQVLQLGPANWERELPRYLGRPGRKWLLVEHARRAWLTQLLTGHGVRAVDPGLTDKFVLLAVDG